VGDVSALSLLLSSPAALAFAAVFGALWGSFYNVCIARIPRGESVVRPGSHCFSCGTPVRALDNIPIASYFLLRGRCRSCGATFSPRYALTEALSALLGAAVYWRFVMAAGEAVAPGLRLARFALYFALVGVLLVLSFIDLDTKRLPDVITLPAIAIFFAAAFAIEDVGWKARLIGVVAGYLGVRIISDGYYYLRGREGLGLGDGKLLAVIGAVLGWQAILVVVFMGSFLGVAVSVPLLVAQRRAPTSDEPSLRQTQVPFGPFLSLSAVIYLLFRDPLWGWLVERLTG
jgi:leader peptidase (prepilin peptidase)/N-methyltransferase